MSDLTAVVHREGWADWRWEVHSWVTGRPWWAEPLAKGSALTERAANRAARRAAADIRRADETRTEARV